MKLIDKAPESITSKTTCAWIDRKKHLKSTLHFKGKLNRKKDKASESSQNVYVGEAVLEIFCIMQLLDDRDFDAVDEKIMGLFDDKSV